MAQRDSARQEESIGTTLVLNGGVLTLNNKVLSVGGSVVPSRGVPGVFGAWGLALCFLTPPPPVLSTNWAHHGLLMFDHASNTERRLYTTANLAAQLHCTTSWQLPTTLVTLQLPARSRCQFLTSRLATPLPPS